MRALVPSVRPLAASVALATRSLQSAVPQSAALHSSSCVSSVVAPLTVGGGLVSSRRMRRNVPLHSNLRHRMRADSTTQPTPTSLSLTPLFLSSMSSSPSSSAASHSALGSTGGGGAAGGFGPSSTIGFIGAGAMASAIAKGIGEAKLVPFSQMWVSDVNPGQVSELTKLGMHGSSDNSEVAANSDVLFLCTKPDAALPALAKLSSQLRPTALVVSVCAGLSLASLEGALPDGARVVRVMPNTPALVGMSASAFTMGTRCSDKDAKTVSTLLKSIGTAIRVPEKDLNAVTGLSGSGPAYVFLMLEALADGGVRAGLPRAAALQLAVQTVLGSAKLVSETGSHPALLKDQVASPGGTTIAGIHALESGHFRGVVMDAVLAASRRAQEMGAPAKAEIKSKL